MVAALNSQELKAEPGVFPIAAIEKAGYGAVWVGQKTWNGVAIAILSRRHDLHGTCDRLPGDPADRQSRCLEAAINGIIIVCTYLPNRNS
jgi:exodeoxyribonuclease-3